MKIERIFKEESNISIEDIINLLIKEKIDNYLKEYYSSDNHTTSSSEGDVL